MRNSSCDNPKWDKRYLLAFLITLFCSIICGIVLYKTIIGNVYFVDLASDYVYNVFNYRNAELIFTRLLSDLIYLYIIFLLCYFTGLKYLSLLLIFLRGLFFGLYLSILICINAFGGVIISLFVFLPATLISIFLCYLVADFCKVVNKKFVFLMPLVLALVDCLIYCLLINVLFRVIIAIA